MLLRDGREQPLIPRYFDLLVDLIEHRHEAVHRRDIFDRVWSDVVVSDSALSQAVRTLRRTLGDDSREPQFIRTVARHGYQFVFADVQEEEDAGPRPTPVAAGASPAAADLPSDGPPPAVADPFEALLERLCEGSVPIDAEERVDAAERLHALGTAEALSRLGTRPGHARARALLRETRWVVPGAADVPLLGVPGGGAAVFDVVRLRLSRAARSVTARWLSALAGGALAGLAAGVVGGLTLAAAPGSKAPLAVAPVLGAIGLASGALGGAGVGAGLSAAEALARSHRVLALLAGGAIGGGLIGTVTAWLAGWSLTALVGLTVPVGGGIAGLALGAAAGLGYGWATRTMADGLAAPRGATRLRVCAVTALAVACGALAVAAAGRPLVGGTIHAIAQASAGSQVALTPLAHLIGEPDVGRVTGAIISFAEGGVFGLGLACGLTRRPASGRARSPRS
jgi:DNA-binding winged helix-turn-helix (wHTH) protein